MENLDSILKNRDNTLLTKVHIVKAMVFSVVMYRYKSCTIKKAESRRTDALQLWCWRRLLKVPWTARGSNQSVLKEIRLEYSLEGLMLKLKLQYFGHLMWRAGSLEKTLMLGKTEGKWRKGSWRWDSYIASPTQWIWIWSNSVRCWGKEKPGMLQSMGLYKDGHDLVTEQQQQISVNISLKKKHLYILRNSFHNGLACSLFLIKNKATVKSRFSKAVVSLPVLKTPRVKVKAQRK